MFLWAVTPGRSYSWLLQGALVCSAVGDACLIWPEAFLYGEQGPYDSTSKRGCCGVESVLGHNLGYKEFPLESTELNQAVIPRHQEAVMSDSQLIQGLGVRLFGWKVWDYLIGMNGVEKIKMQLS